jgi:hypothetical protein
VTDAHVYGDLDRDGIEVIARGARYFVRYETGGHYTAWREDELTSEQVERIKGGEDAALKVLLEVQSAAEARGEDPYKDNWVRK